MEKKQISQIATVGVLSLLLVVGVAVAAIFPEDNEFTGIVNSFPNGIKIGKQGTGGVTFFNGTIINDTTTDGANNPVTFGDNVRIDGRIQRGHNGAGDTWRVQVDDGLEVFKDLEVTGKTKMNGGLEFAERTGYYPVTPASFVQTIDGKAGDVCFKSSLVGVACSSTASGVMLSAPLELPQGVTLKSATANVYDVDNQHSVIVYLIKRKVNQVVDITAMSNPFTEIDNISIGKVETGKSFNGGFIAKNINLDEKIDYSSSAHFVYEVFLFFGNKDGSGGVISPPEKLRLHDIRVDYTYTEPN